jgi:coenzyme F420-reducing hydrogenase beta subunit
VFHTYITDKEGLGDLRKSKYSQSVIGDSYKQVKDFLKEGKKVLFSGTPCQIAGLRSFLQKQDLSNLLTVEVICEGVPSPLYVRKFDQHIQKKYSERIASLDYRYTGTALFQEGKWDFQQMKIELDKSHKSLVKDRWFNPFWSVWLKHLMSRPSCEECPFTTPERVADISLGDLWGVHLYCPELYGKNGGASLVIANTAKGREVVMKAQDRMIGHELRFEDALRYQSPMRKSIGHNPQRDECMKDLQSEMTYDDINAKWATPPSLGLLYDKYVWGNRQKIWWWGLTHKR